MPYEHGVEEFAKMTQDTKIGNGPCARSRSFQKTGGGGQRDRYTGNWLLRKQISTDVSGTVRFSSHADRETQKAGVGKCHARKMRATKST